MGIDTSDATWSGSTNPLDAKYAKLNTDLSLLTRANPMHARICAYIQNTLPGATVDGSVRCADLDLSGRTQFFRARIEFFYFATPR